MAKEKRNIFEETTEIIGWIQIFLSPFLISLVLAIIIYFSFDSEFAIIFSIIILIIGTLIGFRLANKIYHSKEGTIYFVSKIDASPELDEEENKN
ncbi:hypothetical protein [Epilithonimonas hominis]|uniref:hypothetical protein n=1 Tax=Epilithonimonas hominis TaxID=420404 RepID=UPI00289DDEB7|nr:hypothetical protein [Epilithonimonas hominis]